VTLSLPVVWSDAHRSHRPSGEVWIGLPYPADEVPERAAVIRGALEEAGASVVDAVPHTAEALLAVHDEALVAFLRDAWTEWVAAGYPVDPGQHAVVGYIFPHPGLVGPHDPLRAASPAARTGNYCFDTMTPVGAGTWEAARGAVDAALTACDLVLDGAPLAYACTRPPGHHVTRNAYGGSCYLNNAAVAAQHARAAGVEKVAIVDVDVHHGNGAQSIFWERHDVLTVSVHVDPAAGWFPHFLGLAGERGAGAGDGANLNLPVAPGADDDGWLHAVGAAASEVRGGEVDLLVVALGVDAAAGDPNGPLEVTAEGFREAGRLLGGLGLPTVVVQEGGYDLATIGGLVLAALGGLEEGRAG
jgi:acetoin utilization deacetylase AcuC-like enzyme